MNVLRNKLYYGIKPLVPSGTRMALRRWLAQNLRPKVQDRWPIAPGSERPPENWSGWPDGKQFGFVITHDVEGRKGLEKCRRLMELEMRLGFRSSFNFVPEGEYRVSPELRSELEGNGFEVGVHDLHHDGRLFLSRKTFEKRAQRINHYLQEWQVSGFRSGFMLNQPDWLHNLNIRYDLSSFDTDPFEPQPSGTNTIFPFWVPNHNAQESGRQGYVELPYTLPQDSTLFLVFRERHPDIWLQKLDWVAGHGGMALLNVHPDYIDFDGKTSSNRSYPAEFYARFLNYVREQYDGRFWHALPGQMAEFVEESKPVRPRAPKRVCMVCYSHYRSDARVTRYAEALAERGDHVDVLTLRSSAEQANVEQVGGVQVVNLQARLGKKEQSKLSYLLPVLRFLMASSWWIAREHLRRPYHVFHIHNVPDFLVFAAALPRLLGARVILDIHDLVPEFYGSKFKAKKSSSMLSMLKLMERCSSKFADHVIIANDLWLDTYRARTGANGCCSVFINNVDTRIFYPRPRTRKDRKLIVLFPGGLQWHQGLDIAIRAYQTVSRELPNAEFHIYGDGNMKQEWQNLAKELGLEKTVLFFEPLPVRQIAEVMANADLGVVPKRADSFGNEAYSTKIMEFMAVGVPVVVSNTKIDQHYFNSRVVRFFESGNVEDLSSAMVELLRDRELRMAMVERAGEYAALHSWNHRREAYLELVERLGQGRAGTGASEPGVRQGRCLESVGLHD